MNRTQEPTDPEKKALEKEAEIQSRHSALVLPSLCAPLFLLAVLWWSDIFIGSLNYNSVYYHSENAASILFLFSLPIINCVIILFEWKYRLVFIVAEVLKIMISAATIIGALIMAIPLIIYIMRLRKFSNTPAPPPPMPKEYDVTEKFKDEKSIFRD